MQLHSKKMGKKFRAKALKHLLQLVKLGELRDGGGSDSRCSSLIWITMKIYLGKKVKKNTKKAKKPLPHLQGYSRGHDLIVSLSACEIFRQGLNKPHRALERKISHSVILC